jgi:hypothetical protein
MTWENDVEVEFKHNGQEYCASADVVVTLEKEDIGPVGHRDHCESYVTQDVEINNLMVNDLENIPEDVKLASEEAISEVASRRAEESMQ